MPRGLPPARQQGTSNANLPLAEGSRQAPMWAGFFMDRWPRGLRRPPAKREFPKGGTWVRIPVDPPIRVSLDGERKSPVWCGGVQFPNWTGSTPARAVLQNQVSEIDADNQTRLDSSAGRAPPLQGGCRRFDPGSNHHLGV